MDDSIMTTNLQRLKPKDWEQHKAFIEQMYLKESKKLKEVMEIVAQNGHVASEKMFKDRIRKWGFDKKNKESEAFAILRMKREREAIGKKSSFSVRGRVKTAEEIEHYLRRKKTVPNLTTCTASTPPEISCWTPSPPSSPIPAEEDILIESTDNAHSEVPLESRQPRALEITVMEFDGGTAEKKLNEATKFHDTVCAAEKRPDNISWLAQSPITSHAIDYKQNPITFDINVPSQVQLGRYLQQTRAEGKLFAETIHVSRVQTPLSFHDQYKFQQPPNLLDWSKSPEAIIQEIEEYVLVDSNNWKSLQSQLKYPVSTAVCATDNHSANYQRFPAGIKYAQNPFSHHSCLNQLEFDHNNRLYNSLHSVPRSLDLPQNFLLPERLFRSIKKYVQSSFENGTWFHDDDGVCSTIISGPHPVDMYRYFQTAIEMRNAGRYVKFRRMLSKGFILIKDIIRSRHPRTLIAFLDTLSYMIDEGLEDVAHSPRGYIMQMASCLQVNGQIWDDPFQIIGILDRETFDQSIIKLWRCHNDIFSERAGPTSRTGLNNELDFIWGTKTENNLSELETLLQRLLKQQTKVSGGSSYQAITVMHEIGNFMIKQDRDAEAETFLSEALLKVRANGLLYNTFLLIDNLDLLSWSQYYQDKNVLAEKNLREAITVSAEELGEDDPLVLDLTIKLERWLREWERLQEADELQARIDVMIGLDEVDEEMARLGIT
ncbi:hypothetical protein PVAG01_02155 [Phlyctema vagabunda]|uniref:Clr5 domain-containing protein n=1 Tax=Phlyctema vagabunda TaxID=108571 RepID=A0ABR4PPZ1_9HELO